MHVVIRNPEKIFFEGFAKEAILPGVDGEFSVWDFHQVLVARLIAGDILLRLTAKSAFTNISINSGVAKFAHNELGVFCL